MSGGTRAPNGSNRPSRRRWGWHRLADDVAHDLVVRSGVGRHDLVLDLGAGDGAVTRHLVATGASVVAFELHPDRASVLRDRFRGRATVVRADITDLRLPRRPFRVVANPPFDGVSAVLTRLTSRHSRLVRADLVLPVDAADRWARRLLGTAWRMSAVERLPRSAFRPRPRIDCCVVTVVRVGP